MFSKTWALANRGLHLHARLLRMHLLRLGVVVVVWLALFGAHASALSVGAPGLILFSWLTYTTLVFATFAGATFFATAITEEKEEQTLGLLTLANIRPAALILGTFLPRLVSAVLIFTVAAPFTLLSITLGGVTWSQVWAAYWTLLAHVVFMGSVGLFFSVVCRTSAGAIAWSIVAMLLYFVLPPMLWSMRPSVIPATASPSLPLILGTIETLNQASAFVRVEQILSTGFADTAFGAQVVWNLAASSGLMALSLVLFGPFNRNVQGAVEQPPLLDRALRFRRGSRRPWRQSIAWKDFHSLAGGWEWLLLRAFTFLLAAGLWALVDSDFTVSDQLRRAFGGFLVVLMLWGAIPVELTVLAARLFRKEIKEGTWPTLAGLPISIPRLALAKLTGGAIGLAPALGCVLLGTAIAPDAVFEAGRGAELLGIAAVYAAYFAFFLVFLHLTALYSILFNAWAGVLLALVTVSFSQCFIGPLLFMPMMLLLAVDGMGSEMIGIVLALAIYGAAFVGIVFGLEVLIAQQLRVAAGR